MIWAFVILSVVLTGLYLLGPFLTKTEVAAPQALDEARQQRAGIDLDHAEGRLSDQAAHEAREALDRRILELLDRPSETVSSQRLKGIALAVVPAVLVLGGVGVYTNVGSPAYEPVTFAEYQAQQMAELPDTLDGLVVELSARLAADPNPPADGYVLLARSYLRLGDVENGLAAYERALEISGGAEAILSERARVIEMLQARAAAPQINPETRAQIEAMSADEQAAMIEGMVTGLALRLEDDPNDAQGWMRLIRARAVMGDVAQARIDLQSALAVFPTDTREGQALEALATDLLPPATDTAPTQ